MKIAFLAWRVRLVFFAGMASLLRWVGRQAERAGDCRSVPGKPLHLQGGANQARPIVHVMQPDAVPREGLLRNSHAIVPDAHEASPIPKAQADFDPSSPSVGNGVIHGFFGDAIRVRLDLGGKPEKRTITLESAGDPEQGLDIRGEGLERRRKTDLLQAHRIETPGQVACVTDGLVQQSGDLGGLNRRGFGVCCELSRKRRTESGDAGQVLAQSVMQLPPRALSFSITGLKNFVFQNFVLGDVAGDRIDLSPATQTIRVPLKPLIRAILAAIAILEENRAPPP